MMITDNELYVGKPVVFDDEYRDLEHGFVTSWNDRFVYCRFFRSASHIRLISLRTVANSEACDPKHLYPFPLNQENIDNIIDRMRKDQEKYGWVEQEK